MGSTTQYLNAYATIVILVFCDLFSYLYSYIRSIYAHFFSFIFIEGRARRVKLFLLLYLIHLILCDACVTWISYILSTKAHSERSMQMCENWRLLLLLFRYGIGASHIDSVDLMFCRYILHKHSHPPSYINKIYIHICSSLAYNLISNWLWLWAHAWLCVLLLNAATCSLPLKNKIFHEYIFFFSRFWTDECVCRRQKNKRIIEDLIACAFVCR